MKKNRYNRRLGALNRLEDQVTTHRMSREFNDTLEGLTSDQKEAAIVSYWERKNLELAALKKKMA